MKKLLFVVVTSSAVFLAGCGQKNPLINDKTIAYLKGRVDVEVSLGFTDIKDCGAYYAGYSNESLKDKEKCDKWSKNEFQILSTDSSMPYKATIENFRDPALWQIVIPKSSK